MKNDQMKKSVVAVVKVEDRIDLAFERLMDYLGGMESYVLPFQTVLLKPNWVSGQDYSTGAVTHPELIKSCIQSVLKCGIKKVYVGDSSMVGMKTDDAINISGLKELESKRVKIIDFKKSEYNYLGIPNALRYRRLGFPKELLEAQFVINLPALKTHDYLPVTLGLKNMKGVLSDLDKRRFHTLGLEEGIIDTNRIALADLTIIDGIIGMEGDGPINGIPANSKVLIASLDPLAAEIVAIKIMGLEDVYMRYIDMAYDAGFGEKNIENINIVGDSISSVEKKFVRSNLSRRNLGNGKVNVCQESACSTCRFIIEQSLSQHKVKLLDANKNINFYCGSSYNINKNIENSIGIGNCAKAGEGKFTYFVSGCPPRRKDIAESINKLLDKL
ncbi:DUF362 domain-containing protein [Clostridium beijerinckii]|uniref:DUF362 domain-containing protein n=1 Tax=Clostridium beijerinckii TaxID=1520 RepID=UPI001494099C|nr:DUF362 domain-containing protein [Clostridium beijerinckii]NOW06637.1 uncharacterized protein (DUF362 family) [Clostridium beijerinckii]NYC00219.1 uncharacterized protein (DUF362 family) [Clostridium beijerinckii]